MQHGLVELSESELDAVTGGWFLGSGFGTFKKNFEGAVRKVLNEIDSYVNNQLNCADKVIEKIRNWWNS